MPTGGATGTVLEKTSGADYATAWTALPTALPPSGAAGGDLAGSTYPNPVIAAGAVTDAKINDVAYSKVTGHPTAYPPSGAASGDLSGTYPGPAVAKLNGAAVGTTTPLARGDLLVADGTPALKRLALGAASTVLQSNGSDAVWGTSLGGPPSGPAGGALSGTYPNPGVVYSAITGTPTALPPSGAAGGDLTGTYPSPTVTPAAKSKWAAAPPTLTPTDTTMTEIVLPRAHVMNNYAAASGAGVVQLMANVPGRTGVVLAKPSWFLRLEPDADAFYVYRQAPNNGATAIVALCLPTGDFQIMGSNAYKASGTAWINPSDPRLKHDVAPYAASLDAITRLAPISFTFNGLGGTTDDGRRCYGLDASAVQDVMPECVGTRQGKLHPDDQADTELLTLDTSNITLALVNAVKELAAAVAVLKATVAQRSGDET